ncbi:hypothetical protein BHE74_00015977 [Ensete ventricosum]|nr:hypothetical protein GW17_00030243 [Ensete ventricosum]RWW75966.1 hypothetical protein BHE74_00015977 [Ensete ventricosum]
MSVISVGVVVASYGEITISWIGVVYQMGGVVGEALRLIFMEIFVKKKGVRLNSISMMYYVSPCRTGLRKGQGEEGKRYADEKRDQRERKRGWVMEVIAAVAALLTLVGWTPGMLMRTRRSYTSMTRCYARTAPRDGTSGCRENPQRYVPTHLLFPLRLNATCATVVDR